MFQSVGVVKNRQEAIPRSLVHIAPRFTNAIEEDGKISLNYRIERAQRQLFA
jgi:hypothetical protein